MRDERAPNESGRPVDDADPEVVGRASRLRHQVGELDHLVDVAEDVLVEIELRGEIIAHEEDKTALRRTNAELHRMADFCVTTIEHTIEVVQRNAEKSELLEYLNAASRELDKRIQVMD